MRTRLWILLPVTSAICSAGRVEIGFDQSISNAPFCGSWYPNLRYQVVVLGEETGTSGVVINEIGWKRAPGGTPDCTFNDFVIHMGLTSADELGMTFLDNYSPGTRTLVFSRSSWTASADVGGWITVALDNAFWYSAASGNLVIELEYSGSDSQSVYIWSWDTGSGRAAIGEYGSSVAKGICTNIPHLGLSWYDSLDQVTFGTIKTRLGGSED